MVCVRRGVASRPREIGQLVHLNNALFFGSSYSLLRHEIPDWMGLLTVIVAAGQCFCAWRILSPADTAFQDVRRSLWLDGAAMLALAAPIQFDRYLVSVSWAVQAVIAFWFCRSICSGWLRLKAGVVLLAAVVHLITRDRFDAQLTRTVWSIGHWTLAWITICFVFVALCAYIGGGMLIVHRDPLRGGVSATGIVNPNMTSTAEQTRCAGRDPPFADRSLAAFLSVLGTVLMLGIFADQWERHLATCWWLGLGGVWLAIARRVPQAVVLALAITLATCVKFLAWDTLAAASLGDWKHLSGIVLNRAVLTGLLLAMMLLLGRASVARTPLDLIDRWRLSGAPTILVVLAALVITWIGTFEVARVFQFEPFRHRHTDPRLAMHVALSLLWSGNAIVLVVIGFKRRIAALRHLALVLFGLTLAKVLVFDLAQLDTIYRIASFVVVGVLLLLASALYQRLSSLATNVADDRPGS